MEETATSPQGADPVDIAALLETARCLAVVGCSPRASRTSHRIARYLIREGFDVIPVNPAHRRVLDRTCYPSVEAIPEDIRLDVVVIFRRPSETLKMVKSVLRRVEKTNRVPVVWTQLGVSTGRARRAAIEGGLPYVHNRCIMTEHAVRNH